MPTISMFYGILIRMYYDGHNPPHFHAFYGTFKARFNLDGELIEGNMPIKQVKLIAAWSLIHKEELLANWELAKNSEALFNITPLNWFFLGVRKVREIIEVKTLDNYELLLVFDNHKKKIKDMEPYLEKGVFRELKNEKFFKKVKIMYGTISWDGRIDLCADELYMTSKEI